MLFIKLGQVEQSTDRAARTTRCVQQGPGLSEAGVDPGRAPNGRLVAWPGGLGLPTACWKDWRGEQPRCFSHLQCFGRRVPDACCEEGEHSMIVMNLLETHASDVCFTLLSNVTERKIPAGCYDDGSFFYGEQCGGSSFNFFTALGNGVCEQPKITCECNAFLKTSVGGCFKVSDPPSPEGQQQDLFFMKVESEPCVPKFPKESGSVKRETVLAPVSKERDNNAVPLLPTVIISDSAAIQSFKIPNEASSVKNKSTPQVNKEQDKSRTASQHPTSTIADLAAIEPFKKQIQGNYVVCPGCPANTSACKIQMGGKAAASPRCCSNSGPPRCVTPFECPIPMTFSEATAVCAANDMRLCWLGELVSDQLCCETGGGCDGKPVWTATNTLPKAAYSVKIQPTLPSIDPAVIESLNKTLNFPVGNLAVCPGCPANATACALRASKEVAASPRCCSKRGPPSCVTPYQCPRPMTFRDAAVVCAAMKMRLCSLDELVFDRQCCGTGGGCGDQPVWTATNTIKLTRNANPLPRAFFPPEHWLNQITDPDKPFRKCPKTDSNDGWFIPTPTLESGIGIAKQWDYGYGLHFENVNLKEGSFECLESLIELAAASDSSKLTPNTEIPNWIQELYAFKITKDMLFWTNWDNPMYKDHFCTSSKNPSNPPPYNIEGALAVLQERTDVAVPVICMDTEQAQEFSKRKNKALVDKFPEGFVLFTMGQGDSSSIETMTREAFSGEPNMRVVRSGNCNPEYLFRPNNTAPVPGYDTILKKVRMWFGKNMLATHEKVRSIPIGPLGAIPDRNMLSVYREKFGFDTPIPKKYWLLVNFKRYPYFHCVRQTVAHYSKAKWPFSFVLPSSMVQFCHDASAHAPKVRQYGTMLYYNMLVSFRFGISPPGHGWDCYRHWEYMMLGVIPVILRTGGVWDDLFADMPALMVDEYDVVTLELLEKTWESFKTRKFNWAKMTNQYWLEQLKASTQRR